MMASLFGTMFYDKLRAKAGIHDLSQTLRQLCGYQFLQLSARSGYRPVALPCRIEHSRAALLAQSAQPSSGAMHWSEPPLASRSGLLRTLPKSISASLCGKIWRPLARALADVAISRFPSLVLETGRLYALATQAPKRGWNIRGDLKCEQLIFWQARLFWRLQHVVTPLLSKAPLALQPALVPQPSRAAMCSPERLQAAQSTWPTARPIRTSATTQACHSNLTFGAKAPYIYSGKALPYGGAFSRLKRNIPNV